MRSFKAIFALAALVAVPGFGAETVFPHPDRIRYDGQCLTIEGKDTFVLGADFDCFRLPEARWRDELRRIRSAGCNAVVIPIPEWSLTPANAERLRVGLRMAQDEFGFFTWAEMDSTSDWKREGPILAPAQLTRRPPGRRGVILVGIGDGAAGLDGTPVVRLKAACAAAGQAGIDVPLFSTGASECRDSYDPELAPLFDSVAAPAALNLASLAGRLADLESAQPDAPLMTADIQSPDLEARVVTALEAGTTILGCRPDGDWPALAAVGRLLARFGPELLRTRPLACEAETGSPDVTISARTTRDGTLYIFARNRSPAQPRRGTAAVWIESQGEVGVDYDLPPSGAKVLRLKQDRQNSAQGEWLPD